MAVIQGLVQGLGEGAGKAFRAGSSNVSVRDISSELNIPTIALTPIGDALEEEGFLTSTENEFLIPGREMSRITLNDILAVVRTQGETGSYRDPAWTSVVDKFGADLDSAVANVVLEKTLSDLLDGAEVSGAGDSHLVDEQ